jgi:uncharacterized membrane protein YcaP (DUF421 family)
MDMIDTLVGEGEKLTILQMSIRAFFMFIIMLFLIRIAGMRTFGKNSSFDSIVAIMLGAVLARGVVGASPYWSCIGASLVMVALHRLVAWLSVKNRKFEKFVKGTNIKLYENERVLKDNLKGTGMSEHDLQESLRLETKTLTLSGVDTAFLETNGRISFILKDKQQSQD